MDNAIRQSNYQDRQLTGVRRKSLGYAYITSIASTLGGAGMLSNPLQLFVIKLGASELYLGLLSFFVSYVGFFSLLSMSKIEVNGKRKVLFTGWLITAIVMSPMVILPIWAGSMPEHSGAILAVVMIIIALRGVSDGYGSSAWFPILQDNVPARITGKFFARLRIFWQTSLLILVWSISFYLGDNATYGKFGVIFSFGIICLIVRAWSCSKIEELPTQNKRGVTGFVKKISYLLNQKPLKIYLLYIITYNLAVSAPAPFQIKMLKSFNYSDGYVMLATSMIQLAAIFTLKFWGKISDRYGNRSVFSICVMGNMFTVLMWILVDDGSFSSVFVFVLYFMWGLFVAGSGIAQTRHMLNSTAKTNQAAIVLINVVSSISLAMAPLLAGIFLSATKGHTIKSGAVTLDNYHLMYMICALLFIIPYNLRRKLRITKEEPTSHVMTAILRPIRQTLGSHIRVMPDWLSGKDDETDD